MAIAGEILPGTGPDARAIPVTTRDLGPGGALCDSPEIVEMGAAVLLRLTLPAGGSGGPAGTVAIRATVTRVEGAGPWVLALRFTDRSSGPIEALKHFLFRVRPPAGR